MCLFQLSIAVIDSLSVLLELGVSIVIVLHEDHLITEN